LGFIAEAEHKKENERRAAKGNSEQVIRDQWHLMRTYYTRINIRHIFRPSHHGATTKGRIMRWRFRLFTTENSL